VAHTSAWPDADRHVGWVQTDGGPIEEIRPGDVVWFPPGLKHWHRATPTNAMTHIAITEFQYGKNVDWLESKLTPRGTKRAICCFQSAVETSPLSKTPAISNFQREQSLAATFRGKRWEIAARLGRMARRAGHAAGEVVRCCARVRWRVGGVRQGSNPPIVVRPLALPLPL
jgi:hypothetical protein